MRIPWKAKSLLYRVAAPLGPSVLYFAQKHITRRSTQRRGHVRGSWRFHKEAIQKNGAKRIIEFGAGKDLAQNIYLSALGIEQTVIDLNPMVDMDLVNKAIQQLAGNGVPTKGAASSRSDLRERYRIDYIAPLDMRETPFEAGTFDGCISSYTLEHIPREAIAAIWSETRRILKPKGFVSAWIDYSDHYAHTDKTISRLNFLRYTEKEWRRFNHPNHFQNRLRHQHHIDLLAEAGFTIEDEHHTKPESVNGIRILEENLTGASSDLAGSGRILAVL